MTLKARPVDIVEVRGSPDQDILSLRAFGPAGLGHCLGGVLGRVSETKGRNKKQWFWALKRGGGVGRRHWISIYIYRYIDTHVMQCLASADRSEGCNYNVTAAGAVDRELGGDIYEKRNVFFGFRSFYYYVL